MSSVATVPAVAGRVEEFVAQYANGRIQDGQESRRTYPRFAFAEPVDIMIDSFETPADVLLANGRDISCGGIGVYAYQPIEPGTELVVSVDTGRERLISRAVAVHSTLSVGMYKVGARFII